VITLTPEEIRQKFPVFKGYKYYLTLVDELDDEVEIYFDTFATGWIQYVCLNAVRSGGVAQKVKFFGGRAYLLCKVGEERVKFGPSDYEAGSMSIEGIKLQGNEVHTCWRALSGAALGPTVMFSQAVGVKMVKLPSDYEEKIKKGGSIDLDTILITDRLSKLTLALEDTDLKTEGATWALGYRIAQEIEKNYAALLLDQIIVQLNPKVNEKTTNCASSSLILAVKPNAIKKVINFAVERSKELSSSKDAHLVIWQRLKVPEKLREYGFRAKKEIIGLEEAYKLANELEIEHYPVKGERGLIGALAAIGLSGEGVEAAALFEDEALKKTIVK